MGSSRARVSLDFLITRVTNYANPPALVLPFAQMFVQVPGLLLQGLRGEEGRVRIPHSRLLPTLLSAALRVGRGPGVFQKDGKSGEELFSQSSNMPAAG